MLLLITSHEKVITQLITHYRAHFSFTQAPFSDFIEGNSVKGIINSNGVFFQNPLNGSAGYEIPVGSGKKVIFSSSFWFGGVDINDSLYLAAHMFRGNADLFSGPYSINNSYNSSAPGFRIA